MRVPRSSVRTSAAVVLILGLVGAVAGVFWWWIAPQPGYRIETDGLYFLSAQPQQYIAADGWFAVMTVVIGLVAGAVVWVRCARAPLAGLVGLAVGALVGAAAMATVGMLLGRSDPYSGAVGTLSQGPLEIRAWSVLLLEAGVAVAVWLILDVLVERTDELDREAAAHESGPGVLDLPDLGYGASRDL